MSENDNNPSTMGVLARLHSMISSDDTGRNVVHECRRCGLSLEKKLARCPECESTDISSIEI